MHQVDNITPQPRLIDYNGLRMSYRDEYTLFCDDAGMIIDWVSQDEQFPREFFTLDNTYVVVTLRDRTPDLVVLNHYWLEGDRGVSVQVLLDFVGQQTDMRDLGRGYDATHAAHYAAMWSSIEHQLQAISIEQTLPPVTFVGAANQQTKPYFQYQ